MFACAVKNNIFIWYKSGPLYAFFAANKENFGYHAAYRELISSTNSSAILYSAHLVM